MDNGTIRLYHKATEGNRNKGTSALQGDELLIREIKEGNARAFKNVMRDYYRELVDFAYHYVDSSHLAKDVVQDVFANIWERRSRWSPDRSLKLYLYQSVKNEALKLLRDRQTERKYIEAYLQGAEDQKTYPKTIAINDNQKFAEAARQAIQSLPERARMTYQLHRSEGLTYKEIAQVMEVSHKTVESQMSRALQLLRERLSNYLPALMLWTLVEQVLH